MIRNFCGLLAVAFVALQLASCSDSCGNVTDYYTDIVGETHFAYLDSLNLEEVDDPAISVQDMYRPGLLSFIVSYGGEKARMYLDLYGCHTNECSTADQIVIHNESYSYVEVISPSDFVLSKFKGKIGMDDKYQDEKIVEHHFHLDINNDVATLSWDIELGQQSFEQCASSIKPAW